MSDILHEMDIAPEEKELRKIADWLYRRIDWTWASRDHGVVALGWSPEMGFLQRSWRGYNESSIMYILGLGSPTAPMPASSWQSYTSTFDFHWVNEGQWYLAFAPLFGHEYAHVWIDFNLWLCLGIDERAHHHHD